MLILFDYGHGGKDPGAVYKGRKESVDVLKMGQAVAKRLREEGKYLSELWAAGELKEKAASGWGCLFLMLHLLY